MPRVRHAVAGAVHLPGLGRLAGLSVAAFSLFSSPWVNGNVPLNITVEISVVLCLATSLAMTKRTAGKSS